MHVELGYGAKWKLIYQFTQSGAFQQHYVDRYTQASVQCYINCWCYIQSSQQHLRVTQALLVQLNFCTQASLLQQLLIMYTVWQITFQVTTNAAEHVCLFTQVYVPDDDIVQLSSSINRAFDIQQVYGLQLAQPALCSRIESETIHVTGMWMESPTVLRYTTFIEIMVTLFSMEFFKGNVTKTLATADSG